ncbi:alkaline phosphatase [Pseudomonas sp. 21]|uniref:alkaline phosphatase D family protein n=1 Tax=Pseudomonas sp. 21 TaxID=1619948 RepID=UPI0005EBCCCA|nr:alkaline phosphatase D family protein [Pseudomonas sp. 21]KJK02991.1 alkaline phosphatase [Pseudomonas sp. 21]
MKLNLPTVGPIVGFTTDNQARIFLRGLDQRDGDGFRRCFAIVRCRIAGSPTWSAPLFNKLTFNFDFTGVIALQGLVPNTTYEYQACWFFADTGLDRLALFDPNIFEWPTSTDGPYDSFTTGPSDQVTQRHYAVGSCRYLLRLFEKQFGEERGDKLFKSILDQRAKQPLDGLVMIGDQIYADDLNLIAPDTTIDEFLLRYRSVFSQPYLRQLMANLPTYMILDDHEIEDNWPKHAGKGSATTLFTHAMYAYQIYQCSHGPLLRATPDGRIDGIPDRYWYTFSDGCAAWFVMDTRTERVIAPRSGPPRIISERQLQALLDWLSAPTPQVKMVVTSVPIFPDLRSDNDDKWGAFQQQRHIILEHIRTNAINKVVFVSGDVHCSFAGKLELRGQKAFGVHYIVSSSFFWPLFRMQDHDFAFDVDLEGTPGQQYIPRLLSDDIYSDDNYARISVSPTEVEVNYYDRRGSRLNKKKIQLKF